MAVIAIVINSLGGGGAERSMLQVADGLQNIGVEVVLIAINSGVKDLVKPSVKTFELSRKHDSGIFDLIQAIYRFRKIVYREKPKALILNCDLPEFLSCFISRRVQLIVVEHANPSWRTRKIFGFIVRRFEKWRGVMWVKVSDHLQITFCRGINAKTIYNPVPESFVRKSAEKSKSRVQRIVFIGRIEEIQKRPSIVIQAAARLNLPCLIIGDGPNLLSLKKLASHLKAEVEFLKFVANPWLEVENGDLVLVPSSYEGDGLVAVEAIIHGYPLMLSNIPDFKRFFLPDQHYFSDLDDLCQKIEESLDDVSAFTPPRSMSYSLKKERSIKEISKTWQGFLHQSLIT